MERSHMHPSDHAVACRFGDEDGGVPLTDGLRQPALDIRGGRGVTELPAEDCDRRRIGGCGASHDDATRIGVHRVLASVFEPCARGGIFTIASPSKTTVSPTLQRQDRRARWRSLISSTTSTLASTVSPIFTGARNFRVCET